MTSPTIYDTNYSKKIDSSLLEPILEELTGILNNTSTVKLEPETLEVIRNAVEARGYDKKRPISYHNADNINNHAYRESYCSQIKIPVQDTRFTPYQHHQRHQSWDARSSSPLPNYYVSPPTSLTSHRRNDSYSTPSSPSSYSDQLTIVNNNGDNDQNGYHHQLNGGIGGGEVGQNHQLLGILAKQQSIIGHLEQANHVLKTQVTGLEKRLSQLELGSQSVESNRRSIVNGYRSNQNGNYYSQDNEIQSGTVKRDQRRSEIDNGDDSATLTRRSTAVKSTTQAMVLMCEAVERQMSDRVTPTADVEQYQNWPITQQHQQTPPQHNRTIASPQSSALHYTSPLDVNVSSHVDNGHNGHNHSLSTCPEDSRSGDYDNEEQSADLIDSSQFTASMKRRARTPTARQESLIVPLMSQSRQTNPSFQLMNAIQATNGHQNWLKANGLAQYINTFQNSGIDLLTLDNLTMEDLHYLKISSELHALSIRHGITILRLIDFDLSRLENVASSKLSQAPSSSLQRLSASVHVGSFHAGNGSSSGTPVQRYRPSVLLSSNNTNETIKEDEIDDIDSCHDEATNCSSTIAMDSSNLTVARASPEGSVSNSFGPIGRSLPSLVNCDDSTHCVCYWSQYRVAEWLRQIELPEFASDLSTSAIHGGLIVLEDRFTPEVMAEVLKIPSNKPLIRRHLGNKLMELVGPEIWKRKQRAVKQGCQPLLSANSKLKIRINRRRGLNWPNRKRRSVHSGYDLVCPEDGEDAFVIEKASSQSSGLENQSLT